MRAGSARLDAAAARHRRWRGGARALRDAAHWARALRRRLRRQAVRAAARTSFCARSCSLSLARADTPMPTAEAVN
eukprot:285792-Pleurochrysis_carterae.AAC.2